MGQLTTGSIREVLQEEISGQTEDILVSILKNKMSSCASILVKVIRALELEYGPRVTEIARNALLTHDPRQASQVGKPEEDLHIFCQQLEKGCIGSHRWERLVDMPDRVGYRFYRCLWAQIFNELKAPDIGRWLCEGDEPAARSFNPKLGFKRTKTLMDNQGECDHVFYVKRNLSNQSQSRNGELLPF